MYLEYLQYLYSKTRVFFLDVLYALFSEIIVIGFLGCKPPPPFFFFWEIWLWKQPPKICLERLIGEKEYQRFKEELRRRIWECLMVRLKSYFFHMVLISETYSYDRMLAWNPFSQTNPLLKLSCICIIWNFLYLLKSTQPWKAFAVPCNIMWEFLNKDIRKR